MPASSTYGTNMCQVVPDKHESPCTRQAMYGGGDKPRLCPVHQEEYVRRTITYKDSSEQAISFSEKASWLLDGLDRTSPLLTQDQVYEVFRAAHRCIAALDVEIRERGAHQKRFFIQVNEGHELWMRHLVEERRRMGEIARLLRLLRIELLSEQRSRALAGMGPPKSLAQPSVSDWDSEDADSP